METKAVGDVAGPAAGQEAGLAAALGRPEALDFSTNRSFAVSFWARLKSWSGDPAFIANKDWDSGNNPGWVIATDNDARIQWNIASTPTGANGNRRDFDSAGGIFSDLGWHHIVVEFDRSPLTDIKIVGHCDLGLIEGGLCNAENVQVLREFRAHCKTLVAVGACAINGGLPAQRNALDIGDILREVYVHRPGLAADSAVPSDPELPLPLARVHPVHEVVHIDHLLPGCPPSADAIWALLSALLDGRQPPADPHRIRYD